jgi:hypothetical protein
MFAGLSRPEKAQMLGLLETLKTSIAAAGPETDA